ncbi:MAG: hypothetical protein H6726_16640 [Sandaracinaceae bacterium]|nr:hypothetical protein [Myxococcales bacterium]MCB9659274.1 hypothetical protein [Sandaracinaceae bacterium]
MAQNRSILGVAARDLNRLRAVSVTVARHGFGELLMRTAIGRRLFPDRSVPATDAELVGSPAAQRFAHMLGELGPTFIKLGQILSMRHDLFSPEFIKALESLQDGAPVLPFEEIRAVVESGLGGKLEDLYQSFDEKPLATASIAQTHLATTLDGERVVIKVQRPGIEDIMRGDLDLLYLGAQVLEASIDEMGLANVSEIVSAFEKGLLKELDFNEELGSLLRMRKNLDPERSVVVPRPHAELSCKTVLTMEFFPGRPVRKVEPRSKEAEHVVTEIVHSACKQVFIDGFFHGDPHAGNILINDEGTLCMIDLGLVGSLTPDQREDLVTLIIAAIANDSGTVARILMKMGTPTQRVNIAELKAEIERVRQQYLVVDNIGDVDSGAFAEEFADAAAKFRIKLGPEYALLIKAAATVEGIVRSLHPDVDLLGITKPYAEQIIAQRYSPQALLQGAVGEVAGLGAMVKNLPTQLDQLLHDMQEGNLQVRAVTPELDDVPAMIHSHASRLALTAFATSMTLGAALIFPPNAEGTAALVLSGLAAIAASLAWLVLWGWHFVGRGKPMKVTPLLKLFRRG